MRDLSVGTQSALAIGSGLLSENKLFAEAIVGPTALLVRGKGVPAELGEQVEQALSQLNVRLDCCELPDGEEAKSLDSVKAIWDFLLEHGHGRDTTLIALGGGVTGDMVGYAAACYQRGVRWINLPTTSLAMADASIGGKTGVNHPLGKNMIGAFHPPVRVLADLKTLHSLPESHLRAGLAEVIKHGAIADADFFSWLEDNISAMRNLDMAALEEALYRSCCIKADIVARDFRESGERALLNFGHTFAHAIETHQNYAGLLHGEAVAVGMVIAAGYSVAHGQLDKGEQKRIEALLEKAGLPVAVPSDMTADDFIAHMQLDKKVRDGKIRLVVLQSLGKAKLQSLASDDVEKLRQFLNDG